MADSLTAVLVLATGDDDRMASRSRAKVLHGFAGRTLLGHVLAAVKPLSPAATVVLVGERGEQVTAQLAESAPEVATTSDPARAAELVLDALPDDGSVIVLAGDAPLLTTGVLGELVAAHKTAATELADGDGNPVGFVIDAALFHEVAPDGSIADLGAAVSTVGPVGSAPTTESRVHDRVQLGIAHRAYNARLLETHMRAGVTIVDPATTWVDAEVTLEPDVTLWPSVELHGSTVVGTGASIGPDTSLTNTTVGARAQLTRTVAIGANVGAGATIGPFAYLRPGTDLADNVHIGTYVELKNATVGEGTKIPHLTYVGDATIGEQTNIGAATVFVNYDGVEKHRSVIGNHVRTGADNMFVAPVEVGDGAYTAAGSVITQDVPPGAMGVGRAQQRNVAGWVARKRPGTPAAEAAARALERQED